MWVVRVYDEWGALRLSLLQSSCSLLIPAFTACSFLSLISSLQVFPLLLTLTRGGPGRASESLALNVYRAAFDKLQFGYGSAKALVFLIVVVVLTVLQLAFFRKRTVEL